jgi:hypothetical protein
MVMPSEIKVTGAVQEHDVGSSDAFADALGGTQHDAQDMRRMSKKQELRVRIPTEFQPPFLMHQ